ncbi:MAG: sigma 54-interacting transcriptional regulator [Pseudomonadota bacterium]
MTDTTGFQDLVNLPLALAEDHHVEAQLARILEVANAVSHADTITIFTLDRLARYLHRVSFSVNGLLDDSPGEDRVPIYEASRMPHLREPAAYVATTGSIVNVGDVGSEAGFDFSRLETSDRVPALGLKSVVLLPLMVRNKQTIGVIQLVNPRPGRGEDPTAVDDNQIAYLKMIAAHASIAFWHARLHEENNRLKKQLQLRSEELQMERTRAQTMISRAKQGPRGLIGSSPPIQRAVKLISKASISSVPILVRGETGTGKEMMASFIHQSSPRAAKGFVVQNCAALPEALLESELFGHVKGAFTGAVGNKPGLAHEAHEGTLFLDEIGDMPLALQAKVLRLLQEGEVRRVGSTKTEHVDVRIVAATNVNLEEKIKAGEFRQDLYYRLNVFPIIVPPLRERPSDISKLVDHFLAGAAASIGRPTPEVLPDAIDALMRWSYPGNVRELKNILERAVLMADEGQPIARDHLPIDVAGQEETVATTVPGTIPDGDLKTIVGQYEALVLEAKLRENDWNKSRAARSLKVSRRTIVEKLNRYDIRRPKSRKRTDVERVES